jgi:integrase
MYSVPQYLKMLERAKRAPSTIKLYAKVFRHYATFLNVPLENVHDHLLPENLIKYSESRPGQSGRTTQLYLSILHRFMKLNGVKFDELELNVITAQSKEDPDDKPLEPETLQKMMDLTSVHGKAILSTLISTGMRRQECSRLLLSDMDGDTIRIRNEIAKGGRGGIVYLTAEAQEFIGLWLKQRDEYIRNASKKRYSESRPKDDLRLFACSDATLRDIFARLYQKVDGEKGKYRDKNTLHSCRRYFRTHAVKTMPLDLVEKILRHSGYLTGSYVRISDDEARRVFHEGENVLYITRCDHRIQGSEVGALRREVVELRELIHQNKQQQRKQTKQTFDIMKGTLTPEDHDAIAKKIIALQKDPGKK